MQEVRFEGNSLWPALAAGLAMIVLLGGCGSAGDGATGATTGTVTTSLSDPPTCKGPQTVGALTFTNVWVTVTQVRANINENADGDEDNWVTLVDLRDNPRQIDLLNTSDTQCVLTTLGRTEDLPPGRYQQIRLHLLSNNPAPEEATPESNACDGVSGFNCARLTDGTLKVLLLNSQDMNGIKLPPGRIDGGAIALEAGENADVNLDFNACDSIVLQGNGELRLKPTVSAAKVNPAADIIEGQVVSTETGEALPGPATIVVLMEDDLDADGINDVVLEGLADANNGSFSFCPLAEDGEFDVVIAAIDNNGVAYNATVILDVPPGVDLGQVGLVPEPATGNQEPGRIEGLVTSKNTSGVEVDVSLRALQEVSEDSGTLLVTVPLFGDSSDAISTMAGPSCPAGTFCASYVLNVPASNPRVGTFSEGGFSFAAPASGPVPYQVNARAFNGSQPNCSPSTKTVSQDDQGNNLTVVPGAANAVTAASLDFTGCTEVTIDSGS